MLAYCWKFFDIASFALTQFLRKGLRIIVLGLQILSRTATWTWTLTCTSTSNFVLDLNVDPNFDFEFWLWYGLWIILRLQILSRTEILAWTLTLTSTTTRYSTLTQTWTRTLTLLSTSDCDLHFRLGLALLILFKLELSLRPLFELQLWRLRLWVGLFHLDMKLDAIWRLGLGLAHKLEIWHGLEISLYVWHSTLIWTWTRILNYVSSSEFLSNFYSDLDTNLTWSWLDPDLNFDLN